MAKSKTETAKTAETKSQAPAAKPAEPAAVSPEQFQNLMEMVASLQAQNAELKQRLDSDSVNTDELKSEVLKDVETDQKYLKKEIAKLTLKQASEEDLQAQGNEFLEAQFKVNTDPAKRYRWRIRQSPFRSDGKGKRSKYAQHISFWSTSPSVEVARHEYSLATGAMMDESNSLFTPWDEGAFTPDSDDEHYRNRAG